MAGRAGNGKQSLESILKALRSLENRVKRYYKAEVIGVFGSYARGEQGRKSDVDILVRFDSGATLFDLVALADFLEKRLKVKVDVVSERALRSELRDEIGREVVAV